MPPWSDSTTESNRENFAAKMIRGKRFSLGALIKQSAKDVKQIQDIKSNGAITEIFHTSQQV